MGKRGNEGMGVQRATSVKQESNEAKRDGGNGGSGQHEMKR